MSALVVTMAAENRGDKPRDSGGTSGRRSVNQVTSYTYGTTLGSGVDGAVRHLATSDDVRGMRFKLSSDSPICETTHIGTRTCHANGTMQPISVHCGETAAKTRPPVASRLQQ